MSGVMLEKAAAARSLGLPFGEREYDSLRSSTTSRFSSSRGTISSEAMNTEA
jgi:hypothetical protein